MTTKFFYLKAAGFYLAFLGLAALLTPFTFLISEWKLSPEKLQYFKGAANPVPVAYFSIPSDETAQLGTGARQGANPRNFSFWFDESWPVDGPRQLYIPSLGSQPRIFVNGSAISRGKTIVPFVPTIGTHKVIETIPRQLFVPGNNRIEIFLPQDTARVGISEVFFGPTEKIAPVARSQDVWERWGPIVARTLSALLLLVSAVGVIIGRQTMSYALSGLAALVFLGQSLFALAAEKLSLNIAALDTHVLFLVLAFSISSVHFLVRKKRTDLPSELTLALLLLAITGPLLGLYALVFPLSWPSPLLRATLIAIGALPYFFHLTLQYLKSDIADHASKMERLRRTVEAQAEELDEVGQIIVQEQKNRAILEERQRFTRDIHDGIGGQLLSLLLRIRSGQMRHEDIASEIQAGLHDLRLVVDSMDHTGDDLELALSTFRVRAKSQMEAADIKMNWTQSEQLFMHFPTTSGVLHLYRFMQEALTNIVRHANASQVDISIRQHSAETSLVLKICDNGDGLPASLETHPGKGLPNMRSRARQIGGQLHISTNEDGPGTCVYLTIPSVKKTQKLSED